MTRSKNLYRHLNGELHGRPNFDFGVEMEENSAGGNVGGFGVVLSAGRLQRDLKM
jgi:hypothetical protein